MVKCPAKTENYSGNCENCNEKPDCMMRDILTQLAQLQQEITKIKDGVKS
jgi:hypothetical protein